MRKNGFIVAYDRLAYMLTGLKFMGIA